ncbi:MAG: DoxX family membrane protein, partial [Burkholderiaceae bacterium]|nr:DoxX family membrane protein [Burkholderiaceae bacterium]
MMRVKTATRHLFGALFVAAGANHFITPDFYVSIMPPYLPLHLPLVYLSGIAEVALGGLLMCGRYSNNAAWGLIALLIAVFPANVHM